MMYVFTQVLSPILSPILSPGFSPEDSPKDAEDADHLPELDPSSGILSKTLSDPLSKSAVSTSINPSINGSGVHQIHLTLTADERTHTRQRFQGDRGEVVYLQLPRGTVLRDRDRLSTADGKAIAEIHAKPEPVYTVTAANPLELARLAYHLGNRHVSLELALHPVTDSLTQDRAPSMVIEAGNGAIGAAYLRLQPDPVLKTMLHQLGATVIEEIAPFAPETGAYGSHHRHDDQHHKPDHGHDHDHHYDRGHDHDHHYDRGHHLPTG